MAERGPLRDRGHVHHPQRDSDSGAEHERDGDPLVVHDAVVQQGACNRQDHSDFARPDAALSSRWRAHPLQRKNKENAGDEVGNLDNLLISRQVGVHGFVGRLDLNIFSMRSVIRNPPTTLVVAATTARNPNTKESVLLCSPTSTMAPTTAMASRALVSDMSGVWSKGETRRMTSNPIKAASMKTNNPLIKAEPMFSPVVRLRSSYFQLTVPSFRFPVMRLAKLTLAT